MIHLYHSTSQKSREVFLSDEIKSGYAKLPNWLQDFVKQKKITGFDAYLWAVLNNVSSGYHYRVATLVNQGYPVDQIKLSIKRLSAQNLVKEIRKHGRWVEWEAIDFEIDRWKIHQSLVENPPIVSGKSTTNKNTYKNINNGENSPKESPTLTPLRGGLNIDHILMPGTRRKRLEDSIEKIIGFDLMPAFFKWLEADFMKDKTKLPIRAYSKKRQDIISLAKHYLSTIVMADRLGETN
jgi:hypothetical protein